MANGKICPRCGNDDFNDDFVIISCSECGNSYMVYLAEDCEIRFESSINREV
ncbi:MAG: hypothetical protein ACRD9Q_08065 [Nitrososphaeraceae archaeon]